MKTVHRSSTNVETTGVSAIDQEEMAAKLDQIHQESETARLRQLDSGLDSVGLKTLPSHRAVEQQELLAETSHIEANERVGAAINTDTMTRIREPGMIGKALGKTAIGKTLGAMGVLQTKPVKEVIHHTDIHQSEQMREELKRHR